MKEETRDVTTDKQIDPRWQSNSEILYRFFVYQEYVAASAKKFLSTLFFKPAIYTSR